MFARILFASVIGGLAAGLILTVVQSATVLPLILEAESYEAASGASASDGHAHAAESGDGHAHEDAVWAPGDGGERLAYTLMANVLTGVGFALLLTAAMSLNGGAGWRQGLIWGAAGYVAFSLAPAMGLPPELPGMAAADLAARQIWWAGTVIATAGGLALIVFVPRAAVRALGVALIVAPHAIGAPHPEAAHGAVPGELAAAFVGATLGANLVFWIAIGGVSAYAFDRLRAPETQRA